MLIFSVGVALVLWWFFFEDVSPHPIDAAVYTIILGVVVFLLLNFVFQDLQDKTFFRPIFKLFNSNYDVNELGKMIGKWGILSLVLYIPYFVLNSIVPSGYHFPRIFNERIYRPSK